MTEFSFSVVQKLDKLGNEFLDEREFYIRCNLDEYKDYLCCTIDDKENCLIKKSTIIKLGQLLELFTDRGNNG